MVSLNTLLPPVGASVSVLTEHNAYYYRDPSKATRYVYHGTIVKSDPNDPMYTFRVSEGDKNPPRIIALRSIITLVVDGELIIGDSVAGLYDEHPLTNIDKGDTPMIKINSWNDRFALIDHYTPSDEEICATFGINTAELTTARELRTAGTFIPTADYDVSVNVFAQPAAVTPPPAPAKKAAARIKNPKDKAETATKTIKKRGRSGNKIATAFASIPTSPVPAEEFARNQGVSLAVLRQGKRFGSTSKIHVRADKETKTLMIWKTEQ